MTEPSSDAWVQIRRDYEHSNRAIVDICAEHGISANTLRDRVRRWGWTPRRVPIPREGPPAMAITPRLDHPPLEGEGQHAIAPQAMSDTPSPVDADPASVAPRLQSAVARVLPAIEAIIARLGAQPMPPREVEQTARALGTLTRTLRELNTLLAQQPLSATNAYDDIPEDLDAFREHLARRIEAFLASRPDEDFGRGAEAASPAITSGTHET